MNTRNDRYLTRKFPHLFASRYADMRETAMCWGFDCGNGWYRIIRDASAKLEPLIIAAIAKDPKAWEFGYFRASQIKEKYGTLRFYTSGMTPEMDAIVDKAESQSSKTCERCGKPGKIRGRGWVYTRCTPCWKREQR